MFVLSCCWVLIGAGVGALAVAAGWGFAGWSRPAIWLVTMGTGALMALGGGWLGTLLFDRYYTTPVALWVSVVGVVVVPRLAMRLTRRPATPAA